MGKLDPSQNAKYHAQWASYTPERVGGLPHWVVMASLSGGFHVRLGNLNIRAYSLILLLSPEHSPGPGVWWIIRKDCFDWVGKERN